MAELSERERRVRNLNAVAEHLFGQGGKAPPAPAPEGPASARLRRWGPLGVVLAVVLGQAKWLLIALKALKLSTFASMLLMVWVYATIWGLPFALGFVLLIFIHELGHALAMRQQGIPASAPVFIPFVGAVIAMRGLPRNAYVEAIVALGGPALGSLAAAGCLAAGAATGRPLWYALASSGFLINLFNLIPIYPLDGGRVIGAVTRWLWAVGAVVGVAVFLVTSSPMMLLVLLLGLLNARQLLRPPREGYYRIPASRRLAIGGCYVGLVVLLVLASWWTGHPVPGDAGTVAEAAAVTALLD